MNIKPINDKIIVEYKEPSDRTFGGVILPNVAKARPTTAKVLAVGPGRILRNGKRNVIPVKPGDDVLISFSGQELESKDEKLRIVDVQDILAIKK